MTLPASSVHGQRKVLGNCQPEFYSFHHKYIPVGSKRNPSKIPLKRLSDNALTLGIDMFSKGAVELGAH